jgi:heat shock protein HtpX
MNLWKLRFSMVATLALIFGLSTGVVALVLTLTGTFNLLTVGAIVVAMNVAQWLFAPYLVGAMYRVHEMIPDENPKLHSIVENLSKRSGIKTPKLMLAQIPLPNAFAYGSPLSGSRVAVTQGLLTSLDDGEVEAVLGHELGHLKHRDVQVMMAVSFLPALFYMLGYSLMLSGMFGNNRQNNNGSAALVGIGFMVFSQVLTLFTLNVSRLREYYADRHSVSVVDGGANKLSTGLAKIVQSTAKVKAAQPRQQQQQQGSQSAQSGFKSLFIADPDCAKEDSAAVRAFANCGGDQKLVDEILSRKLTTADKFVEVFSTHPNIIKRLRALQELANNPPA